MSLLSSTFPALQQSYTPPTLPSFSAAKTQAQTSASNFLTGASTTAAGAAAAAKAQAQASAGNFLSGAGAAADGAAASTGTAQAGATGSAPPTKFHHLLDEAMKKSAQGMARHTASAIGIHPDQGSRPTDGQAATGHAVSVIA